MHDRLWRYLLLSFAISFAITLCGFVSAALGFTRPAVVLVLIGVACAAIAAAVGIVLLGWSLARMLRDPDARFERLLEALRTRYRPRGSARLSPDRATPGREEFDSRTRPRLLTLLVASGAICILLTLGGFALGAAGHHRIGSILIWTGMFGSFVAAIMLLFRASRQSPGR